MGTSHTMGRQSIMKRVNIRAIIADPILWKRLCVDVIIATQAREGIVTTQTQAEHAFDVVQGLTNKK